LTAYPGTLTDDFKRQVQAAGGEPARRKFIGDFVVAPHDKGDLPFTSSFTVEHFTAFLSKQEVRSRGGQVRKPKGSSLRGYSSVISLIYNQCKASKPEGWEFGVKETFAALEKRDGVEKAAGRQKTKEGKDHVPWALYVALGEASLRNDGRRTSLVAFHCFMTLQWNLIARANNVACILLDHLSVEDDALIVHFGQMKTDQRATKSAFLRHVYANPLCPAVCPVLVLGLHLLSLDYTDSSPASKLFPGVDAAGVTNQDHRMGDALQVVLRTDHVKKVADELGIEYTSGADPTYGTHSFRKGGMTFVSSGSIDAPGKVAVEIRAGWAQKDLQDRCVAARLQMRAVASLRVQVHARGRPVRGAHGDRPPSPLGGVRHPPAALQARRRGRGEGCARVLPGRPREAPRRDWTRIGVRRLPSPVRPDVRRRACARHVVDRLWRRAGRQTRRLAVPRRHQGRHPQL
jgi:hypothetical protein